MSDWRTLVAVAKTFQHPAIIVVSAFSGVTDKLLESIDHARGVRGKADRFPEVLALHHQKLDEMEAAGLHGNRVRCEELLSACGAMLRGVSLVSGKQEAAAPDCWSPRSLGVPTPVHENTRDSIVAFGELMSASIISFALNCDMIDSRALIRTDDTFGNANVDFAATAKLCERAQLSAHRLVVVPGFIASTANGLTSVLGRGGSDYSATILGASVRATKVVIWTDVYGVYSADPRLVKRGTFSLPKISFRESKEMAYFGSKVLFPKMVDCCERFNIPIEVRKTCLESDAPFTLISTESTLQAAVSCIQTVAIIVLSGSGMKGVVGISAKVFLALKEAKASAIMICQASSEQELCVVVDMSVSGAAVAALNSQFEHELALELIDKVEAKHGFSVVNLVLGTAMQKPGIASRFFSAAANVNVNLVAIAQPASEMGVSVVVKTSEASRCMQAFHDVVAMARNRIPVVLLGIGNVGSRVLAMLQKREDVLVVCACSSKSVTWFDQSPAVTEPFTDYHNLLETIAAKMYQRLHFVDCTASKIVTELYPRLLEMGVLCTANKQGGSGPLAFYDQLSVHIASGRLRFEATVMAGLPVISTLQNLQKTDRVIAIEGVFSGTLSFVFNSLSHLRCSEAVKAAAEKGYTEPDVRDDLNGLDFIRKLVVLARLVGLRASLEDAVWTSERLVTPQLAALSAEEFLSVGLPVLDESMARLSEAAARDNKRLVFLGRVDTRTRRIECGVEAVDKSGPFGGLTGSNNMICITTEVGYPASSPLVITGPGAGAFVTAQGVVGDVLR